MTNPVIHFEIGGRDLAASGQFYRDLFGWELQPSGPEYQLVPPGENGIGGGLLQTHGDIPPYLTVYVAVADLEATLERAASLGGKPVVVPTAIPGIGRFAMFADLDGNVVGLLEQQPAGAPQG
ncbi:VOC family protein [Kribbella sp. NPDC020789]